MSSETIEPPLGTPNPDTPPPPPDPAQEAAPVAPPPYYSGSTDDLSLSLSAMLAQPKPDPLLGEFQPDFPPPPEERPPQVADAAHAPSSSEDLAALDLEKPLPLQPDQPAGSFDAIAAAPPAAEAVSEPPSLANADSGPSDESQTPGPPDALTDLPISATPPEPVAQPEPGPAEAPPESPFGGLDFSAPPAPKAAAPKQDEEDEDDDEDYDDEPRGAGWPVVLLASYASAVTIGLLWILWGHRMAKSTDADDPFPPANTSPDPGKRAKNSRKVTPPPPIAAEHLTTFGKPVTLGGVEVTPVEVTSGPVELQRTFNPGERQREGADALKLRLKVRNLTKDEDHSTPATKPSSASARQASPTASSTRATARRSRCSPWRSTANGRSSARTSRRSSRVRRSTRRSSATRTPSLGSPPR